MLDAFRAVLKIRVSVVRFRPWPPFKSACCDGFSGSFSGVFLVGARLVPIRERSGNRVSAAATFLRQWMRVHGAHHRDRVPHDRREVTSILTFGRISERVRRDCRLDVWT